MADILIVDDEQKMRHLLSIMIEKMGHRTDTASDGLAAWEKIENSQYDIIITDIRMPRLDGKKLLQKITGADITTPVVFITAYATVESAVEIMGMGAYDYLTKPFDEDRLTITIERCLKISKVMTDKRDIEEALKKTEPRNDIIYASEKMGNVVALAERVAGTDSAVMISGESGTGKEVLARFIHKISSRKNKRFVPVNCAAITASLVESELFGYEKGAFTGAVKQTKGKFEFASDGTIFLDEIGDLPMEAQGKLLRCLQEKKIQRVGGHEEIPVDARVICATNKKLEDMVEKGQFRQDLFFRINVFPIEAPPLRERKSDINPLARHFLSTMSGGKEIEITKDALNLLQSYTWPGNVRELINIIERGIILAGNEGEITRETLGSLNPCGSPASGEDGFKLPPEGISLEKVEKDLTRQALEAADHNQSAAAKMLGLTRSKFRVLMKNLDN